MEYSTPLKAWEKPKRWMRISELSKKANVNRHTVHYYLKEDLLPPPLKTGRTMAFYSEVHLECLRFIRELREKYGMPITAVRQEVKTRFSHHWSAARSAASPQAGRNPDRLGRKGERQRQRIIEQALDLFSAKGYHRTHVSDITEGLGIKAGPGL